MINGDKNKHFNINLKPIPKNCLKKEENNIENIHNHPKSVKDFITTNN